MKVKGLAYNMPDFYVYVTVIIKNPESGVLIILQSVLIMKKIILSNEVVSLLYYMTYS